MVKKWLVDIRGGGKTTKRSEVFRKGVLTYNNMLFLRVRGTLKICTHKNPHSRGDALTASRGTTSSSYFGSNNKKKVISVSFPYSIESLWWRTQIRSQRFWPSRFVSTCCHSFLQNMAWCINLEPCRARTKALCKPNLFIIRETTLSLR